VCFDILYNFFLKRFSSQEELSEISKMYIGIHVNYLLFLFNFNATRLFDRFFKNTQISNFMKIHSVEAKLFHADIRTDRYDKMTSHFLRLANVPKKGAFSRSNFTPPFCLSLLGYNYLMFGSLV